MEAKAGGTGDDNLLVLDLVTYICSAGFQDEFTAFYEKHCHLFDDVTEEQSHDCYEVYEVSSSVSVHVD